MQHQCVKCHGFVELPEGHHLNVCSLCGAVQSGGVTSIATAKVVEPPSIPGPEKPAKSSQTWLWVTGLVLLCGFLYGISKPGYDKYVGVSNKSRLASAAPSLDYAKKRALSEIGDQASAFQREIGNMPHTAHENLPSLAQRIQAIIDATESIETPNCLSRVKRLTIQSMTTGQGAVKLNHARGNGINDPGVVTQVYAASHLITEATEEMKKLAC